MRKDARAGRGGAWAAWRCWLQYARGSVCSALLPAALPHPFPAELSLAAPTLDGGHPRRPDPPLLPAPAPRSRESELQATAAEAQSVASQLESEVGAARRAIEEKERRMLELEKQIVAMRKAISQGKDQLLATKDMQVRPWWCARAGAGWEGWGQDRAVVRGKGWASLGHASGVHC